MATKIIKNLEKLFCFCSKWNATSRIWGSKTKWVFRGRAKGATGRPEAYSLEDGRSPTVGCKKTTLRERVVFKNMDNTV